MEYRREAKIHDGFGSAIRFVKSYWIVISAFCIAAFLLNFNFSHLETSTTGSTIKSRPALSSDSAHHCESLLQINPLGIPCGKAKNLPSIRNESDAKVDTIRKAHGGHNFGGDGDKKHLGGFVELDLAGVSPAIWKHFFVHSVLDVGCGRGTSTSWFALHNCEPVMCVEGSHDAVEKSVFGSIQPQSLVEHDFSRGPWWPEQTFDAVWAVEFLEHVGVNYHYNYVTAFRKAALIFVTSSPWSG